MAQAEVEIYTEIGNAIPMLVTFNASFYDQDDGDTWSFDIHQIEEVAVTRKDWHTGRMVTRHVDYNKMSEVNKQKVFFAIESAIENGDEDRNVW